MVGPLVGFRQGRGLDCRVHVEAGGFAGFALADVLEALGTTDGFQPLAESSPALAEVLLRLDLDEVSTGDRRELELPDLGGIGRLGRLGGRLGSGLAEQGSDVSRRLDRGSRRSRRGESDGSRRLGGCFGCRLARLADRDAFLATLPMHDVRAMLGRALLGVDLGRRSRGSRRLGSLPVEMPDDVRAPTKVGECHGLDGLDVVSVCPSFAEDLGAGEVGVEEGVGGVGVAHGGVLWDRRSPYDGTKGPMLGGCRPGLADTPNIVTGPAGVNPAQLR